MDKPFSRYRHVLRKRLHALAQPAGIFITFTALVIVCMALTSLTGPGASFVSSGSQALASETTEGEEGAARNTLYVFVCGAVDAPGVYQLPEGARVSDAITAAGGFSADANTVSTNLARVLKDEEQVYVPIKDESNVQDTATQVSQAGSSLVNINTADVTLLQTLPGIGQATAQKIVDYRAKFGSFATEEDLKGVSGIGDKKYQAIASLITV